MATMTNPIELNELANHFVVVHPLDDVPEEKVDIENLGPMAMTLECAPFAAQSAGLSGPDDGSSSSTTCWIWPDCSAITDSRRRSACDNRR